MKINVEDIKKMNNDEVIENFEITCINYVNFSKEIFFRKRDETFTNEESQKITRINLVMNSNMYDFACEVGYEDTIKKGVESYVDTISSDER